MGTDSFVIKVSALAAALVLPVISALSLGEAKIKSSLMRYVRCVAAYAIVVILVYSGYLFQGFVSRAARTRNFYSGWYWIKRVVLDHDYFSGLDTMVLISSIIAFAVLFARNNESRIITAFRASFVTFMSFDILGGMVQGYAVEQYVMCAVFNIVGALLFGAVCVLCLERVVPPGDPDGGKGIIDAPAASKL